MSTNFSIKAIPDDLADRLRQRAERNHRSLQRELMAIVEAAVASATPVAGTAVVAAETPPLAWSAAPAADLPHERSAPEGAMGDGSRLLAELDAIVQGSRWGHAPVLTRDQANDRRLAREIEYDAQQAERARGT